MKYEFKDEITSDVYFEAHGGSLPELFENAAFALFSIMYDVKKIGSDVRLEISSEGDDHKQLLFNFLMDLVIAIETKNLFFSDIKVRIEGNEARAFL